VRSFCYPNGESVKRIQASAVLLLWVLALPGLAGAEEKNQILFPEASELAEMLDQADALLAKKNYPAALELYGEIVRRDRSSIERNRLIEVGRGGTRGSLKAVRRGPRRFVGLTAYIQSKLEALPASVRAIFRERNDYRAKAHFTAAIASHKEADLAAFYDEFGLSSYGAQALRRMGDTAFESGRLEAAARHYARLLKTHGRELKAKELRRVRSARLAALVGSGQTELARALAGRLGATKDDGLVPYGDDARPLKGVMKLALAARARRQGESGTRLRHVRGNPGNDASFSKPLHIGSMRFSPRHFAKAPRSLTPTIRRRYPLPGLRQQRRYGRRSESLPVVGRALRRKDGKKVEEGIALLSVGSNVSMLWLSDGKPGPRVVPPFMIRNDEANEKILHGGALARGIYIQSYVEKVSKPEHYRGIPIKVSMPRRKLCALDTRGWRWIWNHQDVLRGSPLARASFPAPPVIVDDTVYASAVLIEGFVHAHVAAFDLWSGRLKWSTWVCSGQIEQTMFGEHAREPLASALAVRDGVVYHCSNLGTVAALDSMTGKPLWTTTYNQVEVEQPRGYYPVYRSLGWANNPPVVRDGVVVVAPLDANEYLAYDGVTGRRLWKASRRSYLSRGDLEYVLGAERGRIVLTGKQKIECRNLRTGSLQWSHSLDGQRIAGRGVIANGRVCVSVVGPAHRSYPSRVAQYDLLTGELLRTDPATLSGHLSVVGDSVIITGQGVLSAYKNRERRTRSREF